MAKTDKHKPENLNLQNCSCFWTNYKWIQDEWMRILPTLNPSDSTRDTEHLKLPVWPSWFVQICPLAYSQIRSWTHPSYTHTWNYDVDGGKKILLWGVKIAWISIRLTLHSGNLTMTPNWIVDDAMELRWMVLKWLLFSD